MYKGTRVYRKGWYVNGNKRCTVCSKFLKYEGLRCPCCNKLLKTKPINGKYKEKLRNYTEK